MDARLENGLAAAGEAASRRVLLAGGGALGAAVRAPARRAPPAAPPPPAPAPRPHPPLAHTLYDVFRHLALEFHYQVGVWHSRPHSRVE